MNNTVIIIKAIDGVVTEIRKSEDQTSVSDYVKKFNCSLHRGVIQIYDLSNIKELEEDETNAMYNRMAELEGIVKEIIGKDFNLYDAFNVLSAENWKEYKILLKETGNAPDHPVMKE